MVRFSARSHLLREIDDLNRFLAMIYTTLQPVDEEYANYIIHHIFDLSMAYAGTQTMRFLNPRRYLIKNRAALSILPYLQPDQFKQDMRVCQATFAFILKEISGSLM